MLLWVVPNCGCPCPIEIDVETADFQSSSSFKDILDILRIQ